MLITMRLPRAAAEKMGIPVGADADVAEATMPSVELAGRMTLATGRAISPDALEKYCAKHEPGRPLDSLLTQSDTTSTTVHIAGRGSAKIAPRALDEKGAVAWVAQLLTACYF